MIGTLSVAQRSPRTRALSILLAASALALASQFALPLAGTPVPITLQPLVVVLAGLLLGPVDGAIAMVVYLAAGAAGLPVFAPMGAPGVARLLGPTGGYLIAYPASAAVAGYLGGARRSFARRTAAAGAGILVLYVFGLAQLALITGNVGLAAAMGVLPFVGADLVKAIVAGAVSGRRSPR